MRLASAVTRLGMTYFSEVPGRRKILTTLAHIYSQFLRSFSMPGIILHTEQFLWRGTGVLNFSKNQLAELT